MRPFTLPMRCVLLVVTLTASAVLWAQPYGYAINSRGDFADDSLVFALWKVNLATGESDYVGWTGRGDFVDIEGLAFSPDQRLFGADDSTNTLVRIGTETGNAVAVGGSASNMGVTLGTSMDFGLTFTCDGELLVSSAGTGKLYRADPGTGRITEIGDMDATIVDLATIGDRVYGIGLGTNAQGQVHSPRLYRVDPGTGRAEPIGDLGSAASPYNQAGLAADDQGRLWAITDRNRVFGPSDTQARPSQILQIDPDSGEAELVAETIVGIESLAIVPPAACQASGGRDQHEQDAEPVPLMSGAGRWLLIGLLIGLAAFRLRPQYS